MRSGELRHRLRLQSAARVSDGLGGWKKTWTTDATIWGAIWPQKGTEYIDHMLTQGEVIHKVRIRYRSGVIIGKRFQTVSGSRILNIQNVINWEERNVYLDCICVEEV